VLAAAAHERVEDHLFASDIAEPENRLYFRHGGVESRRYRFRRASPLEQAIARVHTLFSRKDLRPVGGESEVCVRNRGRERQGQIAYSQENRIRTFAANPNQARRICQKRRERRDEPSIMNVSGMIEKPQGGGVRSGLMVAVASAAGVESPDEFALGAPVTEPSERDHQRFLGAGVPFHLPLFSEL
jgi:hypothetical protein